MIFGAYVRAFVNLLLNCCRANGVKIFSWNEDRCRDGEPQVDLKRQLDGIGT